YNRDSKTSIEDTAPYWSPIHIPLSCGNAIKAQQANISNKLAIRLGGTLYSSPISLAIGAEIKIANVLCDKAAESTPDIKLITYSALLRPFAFSLIVLMIHSIPPYYRIKATSPDTKNATRKITNILSIPTPKASVN